MQIVFISSDRWRNKSDVTSILQDYCEDKTLHYYNDLNSAKAFLTKDVLLNNTHIDCVITDWRFGNTTANTLQQWVRESTNVYSDSNFQFSSLPMLVIEDTDEQNSKIREGFNEVIIEFPNRHRLGQAMRKTIREWRSTIANELDMIGLDPRTQRGDLRHRQAFISYYRLKVLSRQFVDNHSKKLNYIWTDNRHSELIHANEEFYDKISNRGKKQPRQLEKEFHTIFNRFPSFVKGEDFETSKDGMLYEKHLYKEKNSRSYNEVDFLNKPRSYSLRDPEIFEIKRHTQQIFNINRNDFYAKSKRAFRQVLRYRDYFTSNDPYKQQFVKKFLGNLSDNYDFTLLMGMRDEKLEHEYFLEKLKDDPDFAAVNLLTYSELLDKHVKLCNRLADFDIFK